MSLPEPMTPPGCDVRTLDAFNLNVERLMASELVAVSSGDEFKAAVMLWCRSWKQVPAASLPDDDKVLASFAGVSLAKWKKLRPVALRGFVKCLDGRLYHPILAEQAVKGEVSRNKFLAKREADAERLREWRASHKGNAAETRSETPDETRFTTLPKAGLEAPRDGFSKKDLEKASLRNVDNPKNAPENREKAENETRFVASVSVSVSESKKELPTPPPELASEAAAREARIAAVCAVLGLPREARDWPTHWSGLAAKLDLWAAQKADFQAHVLAAAREMVSAGFVATRGPAYMGGIIGRLQREAKPQALPSSIGTDPRAPESDAKALQRLRLHAAGEWHEASWGPPPGSPGCLIPAHILERKDAA